METDRRPRDRLTVGPHRAQAQALSEGTDSVGDLYLLFQRLQVRVQHWFMKG